ncbi:MAG: DUF4013 domain-containing protein [Methanoregula sp.]|nr:DUF4013 domain-containing protein [Methanoregula sp.]
MDFGNMLGDSFAYAKDAIVGKWMQWLLLVIATILLCLPLLGYALKVFRGENPAPEVNDWGTLFVDGIKYLIVGLIYAIPFLIVFFVTIGAGIIALANNPASVVGAIGGMLFGFIVLVIIGFLTMIFSTIGIIRFARTGSMGEAFNFKEISATIAKIGWVPYIISLIVIMVVMVVIEIIISILGMIPVLGIIINIVLIAPVMLFEARYFCRVYDSAGTA